MGLCLADRNQIIVRREINIGNNRLTWPMLSLPLAEVWGKDRAS